jgi:hypothetical protein
MEICTLSNVYKKQFNSYKEAKTFLKGKGYRLYSSGDGRIRGNIRKYFKRICEDGVCYIDKISDNSYETVRITNNKEEKASKLFLKYEKAS